MSFEKFGKVGYVAQTKVAPIVSFLEKDQIPGTRCKKCKALYFPPRADCQRCRSSSMDWVPLKGNCTLITFTDVHFAPPQFQGEAPYLLGLAQLEEGPRVFAPIDNAMQRATLNPGTPLVLRVKRAGEGVYYELQG